MKYQIFGEKLPIVTLQFEAGESIYTQAGGMTWMTDNFTMETNMKGGLMKGLGRMLSGGIPLHGNVYGKSFWRRTNRL